MLLEELAEGRDGNVKRVGAIVLLDSGDFGGTGDAPGFLEFLNLGFRLGVDLVLESIERLPVWVVEETAFLEEEGDVLLSANLLGGQLHVDVEVF